MPAERDIPNVRPPMFRLSRYFSIAGLLGIVVVVAVLSYFYRELAFNALQRHETRANVALTQAFANSVWRSYAPFAAASSGMSKADLAGSRENAELRAAVLRQMRGLPVVKVKIYNTDGITIFSTDPRQVGEDKSGNGGFQSALSGTEISDIVFRDRFDAFEGVIEQRNLISSYIPIRKDDSSPVEAVFEVYSDVTELVNRLESTQRQIIAGVSASLALLYVFLFLIVRRADGILRAQDRERLANEARIHFQAYHDSLTGLPNRASFGERLDQALDAARRNERMLGVMFVDLDNFKQVNDTLGHDAGDELLDVVGKRIRSCIRDGDGLFRMGGDEFMVLLERIERRDDAAHVAQRITAALGEVIRIHDESVVVSASIGITISPTDGTTATQLIKDADVAMYAAKEAGGNRYRFFAGGMHARAAERLALESSLQRALPESQFTLHYAPRIDTASGRLACIDASIHWQHPQLGLLGCDRFMPLVEASALTRKVIEWALRSACTQAGAWQSAKAPIRVALRLPCSVLRSAPLVQSVRAILEEASLAPRLLELEVEGAPGKDIVAVSDCLRALREVGVTISLADFGSTSNSLDDLRRLQIDRVKLDGALVRELPINARDAAIVRAIASMARSLHIGVGADGIRLPQQVEFLRAVHVEELQGTLFGDPLPAPAFEKVLAHWLATCPDEPPVEKGPTVTNIRIAG